VTVPPRPDQTWVPGSRGQEAWYRRKGAPGPWAARIPIGDGGRSHRCVRATVTHVERELNGELERRLGDGTLIHVSHAVGGDAHTSPGQLYSLVVLIERP
jgi:hypothetical protein